MNENDAKENLKEVIQSNVVDLSFIFLILRAKFLFFIIVAILVGMLLINKSLKETIYFTTEGVVYVEKNGKFLNSSADELLKKLLPNYDDDSRVELVKELFTSPEIIQKAVVKSGYNVYLSRDKDAIYKIPNFSDWKNKYHKNITKLIPSNKLDDLYVDNATVDNTQTEKVHLIIKFMDYNEFKIFNKFDSKYLGTSSVDKLTKINDMCSFTLHREKSKEKEYFDPISPLLELPEPMYLTITNQTSFQNLKSDITVSTGDSALVKITTTGNNPYMLSNFTNQMMDIYIHFDIELKLRDMNKVQEFMQNEMDKLEKKELDYTDKLKEIRKNNNTIVDSSYFLNANKNSSLLKSIIRKNKIEITKLEYYKQHLLKNKDITNLALSDLPAMSSITVKTTNFEKALNNFFTVRTKYTKNSIVYKNAKQLLEKQKELLILAVTYKLKDLKIVDKQTRKNYINSNDKLMASMDIKDRIDEIKKQLYLLDNAYKKLYESSRSLIHNKVFIKYSNKIVSKAPVSKKPTNKIVSKITIDIVVGIIVGVILTIIKHSLFSLFLSRIVVSKMTPSKIMGGIPKIPKKSITPEGLIDLIKEDKIAELFTTMETLIFFNHPEIKTIQFTSPYPKDGKTFLARNIAQSLASNNAKVILVNMDLDFEKKQKLRKIDSAKDLKKSIKKIKLYNKKDLYILPFNTTEQNMQLDAKLEKYKKIFASLKNSFDYIILDTPQYPMYSESLSLSTIVDLSVSVVKLNHTPVKVSGKHFRDIATFSKKHIILINNDLIDINSSGYAFIDKNSIKHTIVRLKQKISQI